ncbi:MAG: PD40 domain-containing protein [Anaerolineaceae bacterium]|nr:PD40 domain-containing protein [Anaerolineaceae bacterium]
MSKARFLFVISLLLVWSLAVVPAQAGGFTATIQALAWSPDGQALAFASKDGLFVVTLDGEQQRITDADPLNLTPAWSADGQALLSVLEVDNQAQIYQTPLSGEAGVALTPDVGWRPTYYAPGGIDPVPSADGQYIAFLSLREGDEFQSLYVMAADGSDQRRLTNFGRAARPVWLADSQRLAFVVQSAGSALGDLYIIDRDGSHLQQLTDTGDVDSYQSLSWSSRDDQIVFCSMQPNYKEQIEQIHADGTERQIVWDHGRAPVVSPDGQQLLFLALGSKWGDLTVMNRDDGSTFTIQLPGERAYFAASWSPDGTQIAFISPRFDAPKSEDIVVTQADGSQPQVLFSLAS